MSLINDALKQARKTPPRTPPGSLPPLAPVVAGDSSPVAAWLLPAVVIFLLAAAIFFIGWAVAHHSVNEIVTSPNLPGTAQSVEELTIPVITPLPPPLPLHPPDVPRLQGIFYSATAPSAILDGKTVHPGDQFLQYRVKEITKSTVILAGPDGSIVKLGMSN
jgi:hypothetical protein